MVIVAWLLAAGATPWLVVAHRHVWRDATARARLLTLDAVVLGLLGTAIFAEHRFEAWMQEDAWAEWATVWAWLAAAWLQLTRTRERWRAGERLAALGVAGIAAFCVLIAGEEISWGQRMLGFIPPEAFLAENFQQELNLHNLFTGREVGGASLDSRFLVALVAIAYASGGRLASWLARTRVAGALEAMAPPPALRPWLLAIAACELGYPADLAGEACELGLALVFLAAASQQARGDVAPRRAVAGLALSLLAGIATPPVIGWLVYGPDEPRVAEAKADLAAIRDDLRSPGVPRPKLRTMKRVHKRLFTAARDYIDASAGLGFLDGQASPADPSATNVRRDRKGYFLDPWNNPYWIAYTGDTRRVLLYSFGPNRRRDTRIPKKSIPKGFRARGDDILVRLRLPADGE